MKNIKLNNIEKKFLKLLKEKRFSYIDETEIIGWNHTRPAVTF